MQADMFASTTESDWLTLPMPDANVRLKPQFLNPADADHLYEQLLANLQWRQDHIKLYGKTVKIPRLQAWYGDPEASYSYSGLTMTPLPWVAPLLALKDQCEAALGCRFNSVLANLYRDGSDSMGWHADDEPELGHQPVIASVTLGQARDFDFRHIQSGEKQRITLSHGSLLVMSGDTQRHWQHGISKRKQGLGKRINLTFRYIYPLENQVIRPD